MAICVLFMGYDYDMLGQREQIWGGGGPQSVKSVRAFGIKRTKHSLR